MGLETAANFKIATALAAVQLNAAMQDTVLSEMAAPIRHGYHPLRKLRSLFNLDPKTGLWTSNDADIDKAYAGRYPNAENQNEMATTDLVSITLTTATVEDADPTDIVLTFSRAIGFFSDVSIGGDTVKSIVSVSIVGPVVTIVVNEAYVNGDTITVTGLFGFHSITLQLTAEAVTNNVV